MLATKQALRTGTALTALLALLCLALAAEAGSAVAKARPCRDVVVQFEPEGSGGATEIKAKHLGCRKARKTVRRCINGKLRPGWSGVYRDPKFVLRKGKRRIRYLAVGGGGCVNIGRNSLGGGSLKPTPPAGADRVESFRPNLNKKGNKEWVLVYNLSKGSQPTPVTYFEVWSRKHGNWRRVQRKLVTESPGSAESGLMKAWGRDLNRDGRVEIAIRDSITPSFGEILSIFRQKTKRSLKFSSLQSLGGDRLTVKTRKKKPAYLKAFRLDIHSPDNLEHHEVWKWSKSADKWRCRKDCAAGLDG